MAEEIAFKTALAAIFTLFTLIRAHFRRITRPPRAPGAPDSRLLRLLIPFEVATLLAYLFAPRWLAWAALPLPLWLRWFGVGTAATALPLLLWVHLSLGHNFSPDLALRDEHTLITHGPYRWARHPMYTAFYMIHIGTALITANALIGLTWVGGLSWLVALRLRREEAMMLARFGDQYCAYMRRTGRFLTLPWT
ncbi:MAG: isoprenylcysteine carboxylmethyltransferase family protein [Anaerolineae bacterium]|nr:isoprenylcysteine carboxylmethyltransferase family protein [Anaerolineae bacterium]